MGLIIDDLANIIRKHQKTLPNLEKLDVDDEFVHVNVPTEDGDLSIKNEMFTSTGLRKVHLEVASLGKLDILHCIWYPEPDFDIPIFGADIVANDNICSAAITDISPVDGIMSPVYDEIADISRYYSFRHNRDMPRWGDIFSPYCKFARLETDEDRNTFCHVVNEYLDAFVSAVWKSNIDYNRAEERYEGQINYCKKQKLNDKTRRILAKYFGDRWADLYINKVLFDEP